MSPIRCWQKMIRCFSRRREPSPPTEPPPSSGSSLGGGLDEAIQSAVERLLEDEALTADLVDAAARSLLDWGIAQTIATVQEAGGLNEEAQARLAALRRRMREIARQAGQLPPEDQVSAVQRLLDAAGMSPERAATGTEDTAKEEP